MNLTCKMEITFTYLLGCVQTSNQAYKFVAKLSWVGTVCFLFKHLNGKDWVEVKGRMEPVVERTEVKGKDCLQCLEKGKAELVFPGERDLQVPEASAQGRGKTILPLPFVPFQSPAKKKSNHCAVRVAFQSSLLCALSPLSRKD